MCTGTFFPRDWHLLLEYQLSRSKHGTYDKVNVISLSKYTKLDIKMTNRSQTDYFINNNRIFVLIILKRTRKRKRDSPPRGSLVNKKTVAEGPRVSPCVWTGRGGGSCRPSLSRLFMHYEFVSLVGCPVCVLSVSWAVRLGGCPFRVLSVSRDVHPFRGLSVAWGVSEHK